MGMKGKMAGNGSNSYARKNPARVAGSGRPSRAVRQGTAAYTGRVSGSGQKSRRAPNH